MKKKLKVCIVRSMYNSTFELFQSANRELKKKNITASVIKLPSQPLSLYQLSFQPDHH